MTASRIGVPGKGGRIGARPRHGSMAGRATCLHYIARLALLVLLFFCLLLAWSL